ncbi:SNF2 family N-terminal domain-containing protein [Hygrophoropsis aurantiaca]|uniref:SNF2 family N-terminal domain-containing protein n=1 Tax=Hygrophoropsis aurantiaca TaxID=72124 RepID=A0ACB8AD50_9AGAM|nr:SNF2 family N-terminal domain-containing protein [Hygrophoropsis aurantiaca]
MSEDGPPRKRINRGPPLDAITRQSVDAPGSPEIQRLGYRYNQLSNSTGGLSTSSEESMPDIRHSLDGASKPRIIRGQRPERPVNSQTDKPFFLFKMGYPDRPDSVIRSAWDQANGDKQVADNLLKDPSFGTTPAPVATKPLSNTTPEPSAEIGRVAEVDEATKAIRAALKEKGKKSSIYANRVVLDTIQTTPSTSNVSLPVAASPLSPMTPAVISRRKRPKKMVIDSDDEDSASGSEGQKNTSTLASSLPAKPTSAETKTLDYFNKAGSEALQELTGCTLEQAEKIIELRPFSSSDDLSAKLSQGKKKAGPAGISPRIFEDCKAILEGYGTVDSVLEECEQIGSSLRLSIATWTMDGSSGKGKGKEDVLSTLDSADDGSLSLRSLSVVKNSASKDYLSTQPALLPAGVKLKDYQLLGVNWLYLLYRKKLSCILADEMGLGKTIQVISFFAYLKERGHHGPHLVVVPSSTLENWCREFARFAPSISIQTYYAGKEERSMLRQTLLDTQRRGSSDGKGWEVLVTTYNLAQGDEKDRKFFRRIEWDTCVFDEGHVLKNFQSQRYQALLKFESNWRLLLTGTPLQNNLQELVSLMNFILPDLLADAMESLRAIFKTKGDSKVTLLSQERVSRAKKMMTPFVLRRRKDQVLKDLPAKTERIEWCEMTALQKTIYDNALQRSRKTILEPGNIESAEPSTISRKPVKKKTKTSQPKVKMYLENSSNVLMDLRKASSHPMLFRKRFTDDKLTSITKQLLKEPDFKKRGAIFQYVKEDMEVMTDAELQFFCQGYKSTQKFLENEACYLEAGKVTVLLRLLEEYGEAGRKVLIFSQFTQILDILQAILKQKSIKYLLLTGSTTVDVRQTLVDEFTEDESIPVFLLSTKAGSMGINLTAASVVIMFDQDFNPHNDRQAQDRAYRIGQKRDVEVVKLISRGTIEEDMLRLGETKLALDEAVAGDNEEAGEGGENAQETQMKTSLMNVLRKQFEKQNGDSGTNPSATTPIPPTSS